MDEEWTIGIVSKISACIEVTLLSPSGPSKSYKQTGETMEVTCIQIFMKVSPPKFVQRTQSLSFSSGVIGMISKTYLNVQSYKKIFDCVINRGDWGYLAKV